MKRIATCAGLGTPAVLPAVAGVRGNASFSEDLPVHVSASAHAEPARTASTIPGASATPAATSTSHLTHVAVDDCDTHDA